MAHPLIGLGAAIVALALVPCWAASAAGLDLHAQWDQRCQSCHGHASEFARRFLRVENGRLAGRHHRDDLERFLHNHYLADDLVGPVMAMLAAQVTTPPLFRAKCGGCHGSGAEFVRESLVWQGGRLVGQTSGRDVADTLRGHGGLRPTELKTVTDSLARIAREIGLPAR